LKVFGIRKDRLLLFAKVVLNQRNKGLRLITLTFYSECSLPFGAKSYGCLFCVFRTTWNNSAVLILPKNPQKQSFQNSKKRIKMAFQTQNLIEEFNNIISVKHNCVVNIVNDKLTLSVFSMLQQNLANIKEINFIMRNTNFIPKQHEIIREFEIDINETLFNAYDIVEKNKLTHFDKAKTMSDFIKEYVNIKKTIGNCQINGNILLVDNDFMFQGSSSLEISNRQNKINYVNFDSIIKSDMDKKQIEQAQNIFSTIWNNSQYTKDCKEEILNSLEYIYKEHSAEFLYYYTLNDLFKHQLDYGIEKFENDNVHFKQTKIWQMLYPFQKDAVLSAIQKIHKYNGCIIADSVGLGKTFEALAIIKYFELRQDNVLVLTPAKLYDNWNSFKGAYKDSFLEETFNYKIMFHTDLSRYKGESKSGYDLSRFDWAKYDLLVIDESHNFRNRAEKQEGITRYQRLMNDVIKANKNTKVLLLSATPVNNSLLDLRNQISIITTDNDGAFDNVGIESIANVIKNSSTALNRWSQEKNKLKEDLYDMLPADFYKLLELITIARSRKHITTSYGTQTFGTFPKKLKPDTYTPHIDTKQELLQFKETNLKLEDLILSVYQPMKYIKPEFYNYYRNKFKTTIQGRDVFFHEDRELLTAKMHRFNLFKRLDSSVYAFSQTLYRLLQKINSFMDLLNKNISIQNTTDSEQENNDVLDYKYEIEVKHLKKKEYIADLQFDKKIIEEIYNETEQLLKQNRDNKLKTLTNIVLKKIKTTPYNIGNKKVLVFTAFTDTATYLFENLCRNLSQENITIAMVSGSQPPKCNNTKFNMEFNEILSRFSPKSKLKKQLPDNEEIDVLIGTDCISEGQNLQDCDCVVNFDIQWNPVILIQRFGRIDRIGSTNKEIKMINFFPDMELNEYLNLETRVKSKMQVANIASTGDENFLEEELNDISFRKKQLEKLKEEVIDIDEAKDNISLTDLNLNDYLFELSGYLKQNKEIEKTPHGIYSVVKGNEKGVIFCFKHKNNETKPKNESSIYPYYLIYISDTQSIIKGCNQTRELLKDLRLLCYNKPEINKPLFKEFYKKTKNVKDMSFYSTLLTKAIDSIQKTQNNNTKQTIFSFGGYKNPFESQTQDDFELISFLVVR
jgi:ERCC4-related helicase